MLDHIRQKQDEINKSITSCIGGNSLSTEDLEKSVNDYFEKGGKKAVIGETRTFGGREYIKTAAGWKFHGKGTGAKAQEHRSGALGHHVEAGKEALKPKENPTKDDGSSTNLREASKKKEQLVEQFNKNPHDEKVLAHLNDVERFLGEVETKKPQEVEDHVSEDKFAGIKNDKKLTDAQKEKLGGDNTQDADYQYNSKNDYLPPIATISSLSKKGGTHFERWVKGVLKGSGGSKQEQEHFAFGANLKDLDISGSDTLVVAGKKVKNAYIAKLKGDKETKEKNGIIDVSGEGQDIPKEDKKTESKKESTGGDIKEQVVKHLNAMPSPSKYGGSGGSFKIDHEKKVVELIIRFPREARHPNEYGERGEKAEAKMDQFYGELWKNVEQPLEKLGYTIDQHGGG